MELSTVMKKNVIKIVINCVICIGIIAVVGLYIYSIAVQSVPVTDNLFRTLAIVFTLTGILIRVNFTSGRKSLGFYENVYREELGQAFINDKVNRKKLLCALRLYNENNLKKAVKYLFDILPKASAERDAVVVLFFIALCYTDAGLTENAMEAYHKVLQYDRTNAQALSNLGLLYVKAGEWENAIQYFDKSIEYKPNNYYAYVNKASCYFRQADYNNAIINAEKALEIKRNGKEALSLLTIIYSLKSDAENKNKYFRIAVNNGYSADELNDAIEFYMKGENK